VAERKRGFFVKLKDGDNFNRAEKGLRQAQMKDL